MSVDAYKEQKVEGFPVGGIIKAFSMALTHALSNEQDCIMVFDKKSYRSVSSRVNPSFRDNRNAVSITAQMDLLFEKLQGCNIAACRMNGKLADDLVYNIVQRQQSNYRSIDIFTGDKDLAHNVTESVSVFPVNSKIVKINWMNFATAVAEEIPVRYNTISAYKVFMGCKSDGIKRITNLSSNNKPEYYYRHFLNFCDQVYKPRGIYPEQIKEKKLFNFYVKSSDIYTEGDKELLYKQVEKVFPKEISDEEFKEYGEGTLTPSTLSDLNIVRVSSLLSDLGLNVILNSLKYLGAKEGYMTPTDRETYRQYARICNDGTYAVQNKIPPGRSSFFTDLEVGVIPDVSEI